MGFTLRRSRATARRRLRARAGLLAVAVAAATGLAPAVAGATSTEVQEGWALIRTTPFANAPAAYPGGPQVQPYDYAPTIIEEGGYQRIWWCGLGPDLHDNIYYARIRQSDGAFVEGPGPVLVPLHDGSWQSTQVCDPTVVRGAFQPGDGHTYNYAMYYTASPGGIGVVYSDNGVTWNGQNAPYNPIVPPERCPANAFYGTGQAEAWNQNGLGHVFLFFTSYCQNRPNNAGSVFVRESVDQSGYHFGPSVQLSAAGIGGAQSALAWNDGFAVDSTNGLLYVAAPNWRWCARANPPGGALVNNFPEMASFGVYSMPVWTAVSGGGTWTHEFQVNAGDSNGPGTTCDGAARLHSPGFVRNGYGDLGPLKASQGIRVMMARDDGYIYNSDLFWQQWTDPHP